MSNPYLPGEQLYTDYETVNAAQNSPERKAATTRLLGRCGSLEDAERYYQGVDPAHEIDGSMFKTMSLEERCEEFIARANIGLHAAELVVSSVAHPGAYAKTHSRRVRELSAQADWYKLPTAGSPDKVTPYDTIHGALNIISPMRLSVEELKALGVGAELVSSSLTWWQAVAIMMCDANEQAYSRDEYVLEIMRSREALTVGTLFEIQNTITKKAVLEDFPSCEPAETLERASMGLKAKWRTNSTLLHPMFRLYDTELSTLALAEMVEGVDVVFLQNDLLDFRKYPKKEVKGLLHELMWLLDAGMLLLSRPDELQTVYISPSAMRFDRPIIGRPKLLRGVDYGLMSIADDAEAQLINLKSGHGDTRSYHPRVKTVKEENFLDINRGRLTNKIAAYRAIIDGKFNLPETRETIDRFALASVKLELEEYKRPPMHEGWGLLPRPGA